MRSVLALALIAWATLARAGETPSAPNCPRTDLLLSRLARMVDADPSFEIRIYSDSRAKMLLDAFNAEPPPTDFRADRIVTVADRQGDRVMVIFMVGSCVENVIPTPKGGWNEIVAKSIGVDS